LGVVSVALVGVGGLAMLLLKTGHKIRH
jgi:hypothetical protein